jgi:hypothetical protein
MSGLSDQLVYLGDLQPASQIAATDATFWCDTATGCSASQPLKRVTAAQITNYVSGALSATGVTPGAYTNANITVDATGRVVAATSGSGGAVSPGGSPGNIALYTTASIVGPFSMSGDVTMSASAVTSLATVNGNVGTFQGLTVNGKGQVTAAVNQNYAPLASPTFTGTPAAPTAATADNSTALATTAFVKAQAYAPLASPTFTGTPAAPTAIAGTSTTQIATTAFVASSFAPLASPALTGVPIAPTAAAATNTTQLATTAYVKSQNYAPLASPPFTGVPTAPTPATADNSTTLATTAFVKANVPVPLTVPLGGTGVTTLPVTFSTGLQVGAPPGADQGAGSINAQAVFAGSATGLAAYAAPGIIAASVGNSNYYAMGYNGTAAAPTATVSGNYLGSYGFGGYGTAAWHAPIGISTYATENWTDTNTGAQIRFAAKPNAGVINAGPVMTMQAGVQVGAPTGGDKGYATLNATGVYGAGVLLTSDARLKRDIEPLPERCLELVAAIEPKRFRFIEPEPVQPDDPNLAPTPAGPPGWFDRTRWGFVAQDVEAAMAGAGCDFDGVESGEDGLRSLSYFDLLAVLWKAVAELNARGHA